MVVLNYAFCPIRGKPAVVAVINHHGRGKKAGAQAGNGLQIEEHIRCGLPILDTQSLLNGGKYACAALDVAGSPPAAKDGMFASRFEIELGVEGNDTIDTAQLNSRTLTYSPESIPREITEFFLNFLQDINEV